MAVYSIKDLENFTRIKAHTLRIWEQRYNLLNPERSDTNIRLYSERDLKRILNINLLYTNGLKISKIAKLSEAEIFQLANEILMASEVGQANSVNRLIELIVEYNEDAIRRELIQTSKKAGVTRVFVDLIVPALKKIGELWQVDSISVTHEHFFSNLLRDFLVVQAEKCERIKPAKGKVILFLKEGEYHELGLLFYNYYLKSKGYDCLYLGQSVPLEDLRGMIKSVNPDFVFTSLIAKMNQDEFTAFFDGLGEFIDYSKIYVGGYQLSVFKSHAPKDVNIIRSVESIEID